ncbi:hypothetical protein AURDEDRAFT_122336 [Auricularia subglabra TFB-10046 SS5]|nr:hypothetical protein AURDEDRAFT_122336 [Auricularia subglabra TFB-10046 SS5]
MSQRQTRRNVVDGAEMLEIVSDRGKNVTKPQRELPAVSDSGKTDELESMGGVPTATATSDAIAIDDLANATKPTTQKQKKARPPVKAQDPKETEAPVVQDKRKRAKAKARGATNEPAIQVETAVTGGAGLAAPAPTSDLSSAGNDIGVKLGAAALPGTEAVSPASRVPAPLDTLATAVPSGTSNGPAPASTLVPDPAPVPASEVVPKPVPPPAPVAESASTIGPAPDRMVGPAPAPILAPGPVARRIDTPAPAPPLGPEDEPVPALGPERASSADAQHGEATRPAKTPLFLPGTPSTEDKEFEAASGADGMSATAADAPPTQDMDVDVALDEKRPLDDKIFDLSQQSEDPLLNKIIEAVADNEFPQDAYGAPIQDDDARNKPGPFSQAELDRIHGVSKEFYGTIQEIARETRRSVSAVLHEAKIAMKLSNKPSLYNLHTKRFCAKMRADTTVAYHLAGKLSLKELRQRWNQAYRAEVMPLSDEGKQRLYEELLEWEAGEEKKLAKIIKRDGTLYKVMLRIKVDFDELATYYYNLYDVVVVGFVVSSNPGDADATRANGVFAPNKGILKLFQNSDLKAAMGELGSLATTQRAAAVRVENYSKEEEDKVVGSNQQIIKDHTWRVIRELQASARKERKPREKVTWTNFPIELVSNRVCLTGWEPGMPLLDKGKTLNNNVSQCRDFLRADFESHRDERTGDAILGIRPFTDKQLALYGNPKTLAEWLKVPVWVGSDGVTRLTVGQALAMDRDYTGRDENDQDGASAGKRKRARAKKVEDSEAPAEENGQDGAASGKRKRGRGKKVDGDAPPKKKAKPAAPAAKKRREPAIFRRKIPSPTAPLPVAKKPRKPRQYEDNVSGEEEAVEESSETGSGSEDGSDELNYGQDSGVDDDESMDEDAIETTKPSGSRGKGKQVGGSGGALLEERSEGGASGNAHPTRSNATTPLPFLGSLQESIAQRTALSIGDVPLADAAQSSGAAFGVDLSLPVGTDPTAPGVHSGDIDVPMGEWFGTDTATSSAPFVNGSVSAQTGPVESFGNAQLGVQLPLGGQLPLGSQLPQSAGPFNSNGSAGSAGNLVNMLNLLTQMPPQFVAQLQNTASQMRGPLANQFPGASPSFFPQQTQMNGMFNQPAPPNDAALVWQLAQLLSNGQNGQGGGNWPNGMS